MKIKGTITLIETEGRKDTWVKKQLANDYFLALKITEIDGKPITTLGSTFEALKPSLPAVEVDGKNMIELFETVKLAPGMTDCCHLSLAYFGDFRIGRDTANDLDQDKLDAVREEINGQEVSFDIEGCPFQIVSTSENNQYLKTEANVVHAPFVGSGRDSIMNLLPGKNTQIVLSNLLATAFGEKFQLWNSRKEAVPFHVTIAQTNQLNAVLETVQPKSEEMRENTSFTI